MENDKKNIQLLLILIAIILVTISLTGDIVTSQAGGVSLFTFESFYFFIIGIIISLYFWYKNKNNKGPLAFALITYPWTYYRVYELIYYIKDVKLTVTPLFYLYLSSYLFLFIAMFFSAKSNKNIVQETKEKETSPVQKEDFLFTRFLIGAKEIPYNTSVLLVNNIPSQTLDMIYMVEQQKTTKQIPLNNIMNLSYIGKLRTANYVKTVEENQTKSMLLSAAMFGGSPLLQLLGTNGFRTFFDSVSNNYDRINFSTEYEITIQFMENNMEQQLKVISDENPEIFIQQIKNTKQ